MLEARGLIADAIHPLQASQILRSLHAPHGGKGIRTPDIQLAKLALCQLSYAPGKLYYPGKSVLFAEGAVQKLNCGLCVLRWPCFRTPMAY